MKRRGFVAFLAGVVAASVCIWPLTASAQQNGTVRRLGVLSLGALDAEMQSRMSAFRQGLASLGWPEGPNLRIEQRWAVGDAARLHAGAIDLMALKPDAILAAGGRALDALVRAKNTLPTVFIGLSDPVGQGFVGSLARPGANITGLSQTEATVVGKTLETLKQLAPNLARVALVAQRENPNFADYSRALERAATALGVRPVDMPITEAPEIESAIASFAREPAGGLIVMPDLFMSVHSERLLALAARLGLPAAYASRSFVANGGLMSYGIDNVDMYRRAAGYVDRILRGEKPGELPVQSPSKFELVINLKTARALGLDVPLTLLASADEVIE